MLSIEIIFGDEDLLEIARDLSSSNLSLIFNERRNSPKIDIHGPLDILKRDQVSAYALKEDWVYGDFSVRKLCNTITKETYYDLSPRVNFSAISLALYPPMIENMTLKLGFGEFDLHDSWLKVPGNELHPTPSDARLVYKQILKELKKGGTTLRTPYGKKVIMRQALADFMSDRCIMPHAWLNQLANEILK